MTRAPLWWRRAVIYQVVVSSFFDSNGDGVGDLPGVTAKLDYLKWLGVDAVWLTPIFDSPMLDLGYDVADYYRVHPEFGDLADLDRLIEEAHRREIKILLDWVGNHTSDQHQWFVEARSSRTNSRRDWYLWGDRSADGGPPNNWLSVFGGGVWQWDEATGQFYMHTFLEQQPDLNWRNPQLREAMCETLRFWMQRGVDGFRLDALCLLLKDPEYRDNPPNPNYREGVDGPDSTHLPVYTRDQPGLHEVVADLRSVADEFDHRLLMGELYLPLARVMAFYGGERPELQLPMNMPFAWAEWRSDVLGETIKNTRDALPPGQWPAWTLSSHDTPRLAARLPGQQPRIAAMLLLTLQGTPTLYYGEEIGMHGRAIPAHAARDPQGRRTGRNRDPARTPMQWNSGPAAGFTTGQPCMPLGDDVATADVAAQSDDPRSLLTLYRRLLRLRREEPALLSGGFHLLSSTPPLLSWRCDSADERVLVVLNLSAEEHPYGLTETLGGAVVLSTWLDREGEAVEQSIILRGDEGVVIRLVD